MAGPKPACKNLVLDAGPLLTLTPLRGVAERYLTVPHVLSELKDKNAREHFERLGLMAGVKVEVLEPDAASLSQVIQFAKKTGDYSVLSHADLSVLALTLFLDTEEKSRNAKDDAAAATSGTDLKASHDSQDVAKPSRISDAIEEAAFAEGNNDISNTEDSEESANLSCPEDGSVADSSSSLSDGVHDEFERVPLDAHLESDVLASSLPSTEGNEQYTKAKATSSVEEPLFEDPSDEDDGEGEWITPTNVDLYKSRALDLLPSDSSLDPFKTVSNKKGKGRRRRRQPDNASGSDLSKEQVSVGCMTADFAMQNVLLQMGLSLVGVEGKKIEKVKTWVLRCHACFKICKESDRKFCPSCGNPTLLRTSVTVKSPTADDKTPALEVHLKKNFVYRTRGTKYSIPAPKAGSSKTGTGEGLILREDQSEYMRAKKHEAGRREREDRKLLQNTLEAAKTGTNVKMGSWMDPDWIPEMLSAGASGKGRQQTSRVPLGADGMPVIGYGRKNPNEKRRKR